MNRRLWLVIGVSLLNASLPVAFLAVRLTTVIHDLEARAIGTIDPQAGWRRIESAITDASLWTLIACLPVAAFSGWLFWREAHEPLAGLNGHFDETFVAGEDDGIDLGATQIMMLPPTVPTEPDDWPIPARGVVCGAKIAPQEN